MWRHMGKTGAGLASVFLLCLILGISGCGTKSDSGNLSGSSEPATKSGENTTTTSEGTTTIDQGATALGGGEAQSLLNGMAISAKALNTRPLAVMFDNHFKARPQAGLGDADIVYEAFVEGQITRYMAIYQSTMPTGDIGPIRSARPYFIDLALEYGANYAHVGGSEAAKADLIRLKKQVADIEGLVAEKGVFWRHENKPKPNNMYATPESLIGWATKMGYGQNSLPNLKGLDFSGPKDLDTGAAMDMELVHLVYKKPTAKDSVGYFVEFEYNKETSLYLRRVNGKPHMDEASGDQLQAKSIIVQIVKTRALDDVGRLDLTLIGKGKGYYFCEGKVVPITWEKTAEAERTQFFDVQGQPLAMVPGKLWIQLMPSDFQLNAQ